MPKTRSWPRHAAAVLSAGLLMQAGGCNIDTQALTAAVLDAAIQGAAAGLTQALAGTASTPAAGVPFASAGTTGTTGTTTTTGSTP